MTMCMGTWFDIFEALTVCAPVKAGTLYLKTKLVTPNSTDSGMCSPPERTSSWSHKALVVSAITTALAVDGCRWSVTLHTMMTAGTDATHSGAINLLQSDSKWIHTWPWRQIASGH